MCTLLYFYNDGLQDWGSDWQCPIPCRTALLTTLAACPPVTVCRQESALRSICFSKTAPVTTIRKKQLQLTHRSVGPGWLIMSELAAPTFKFAPIPPSAHQRHTVNPYGHCILSLNAQCEPAG